MRCAECGGQTAPCIESAKVKIGGQEITIVNIHAEKCTDCAEIYLSGDAVRYVEEQMNKAREEGPDGSGSGEGSVIAGEEDKI